MYMAWETKRHAFSSIYEKKHKDKKKTKKETRKTGGEGKEILSSDWITVFSPALIAKAEKAFPAFSDSLPGSAAVRTKSFTERTASFRSMRLSLSLSSGGNAGKTDTSSIAVKNRTVMEQNIFMQRILPVSDS